MIQGENCNRMQAAPHRSQDWQQFNRPDPFASADPLESRFVFPFSYETRFGVEFHPAQPQWIVRCCVRLVTSRRGLEWKETRQAPVFLVKLFRVKN